MRIPWWRLDAWTADPFRLSDEQGTGVGRLMPTKQAVARRVDDRRIVSGIHHLLHAGGRWRDVPAACGPAPRSTIDSTDGHGAASGAPCWLPWPRRAGSPRRPPSTAPPSRRTAAPAPVQGTDQSGHRPIAVRADQKVHIVSDTLGRPAVVHPTSGNASDARTVPDVPAAAPGRIRRPGASSTRRVFGNTSLPIDDVDHVQHFRYPEPSPAPMRSCAGPNDEMS